jgi:L-amino acid N-acyltransferase
MELLIRNYQPTDAKAMLEIYNWAVLHTTATYDYEEMDLVSFEAQIGAKIGLNYPVIVAEIAEKVVAYAALGQFRVKEGYRFTAENSVYVSPQHQGKNIGRQLLQTLIKLAKENGNIKNIIAVIDAESEVSVRLHQQLGFEQAGHFPRIGYKFGRWLDVKFLQLGW